MSQPLHIQRFTTGPFQENAWVVVGGSGRKALLVDPGLESEPILGEIERQGLTLEWIVNTHGHLDHVAGNRFFRDRTGARLAIHSADAPFLAQVAQQAAMFGLEASDSPPPDLLLAEGVDFVFDGLAFRVLHTPGHTPGGVCLFAPGHAFVGDTLFQGSVGRTDLPGGSWPDLERSVRDKLFALPPDTVCHPGHGPDTTIGAERRDNPFVGDAVRA